MLDHTGGIAIAIAKEIVDSWTKVRVRLWFSQLRIVGLGSEKLGVDTCEEANRVVPKVSALQCGTYLAMAVRASA